MILVVDTANEETFLGLWDKGWLSQIKWLAGRNLSADIMWKLEELFEKADKNFKETKGLIVNAGPGSFTGLRIGISIANIFAYSLNIPIVGLTKMKNSEQLLKSGNRLLKSKKYFEMPVRPTYGREPNITISKK
jgi:tRNA threonylcarbamoyladenosine biosynthesis protein TsaB